MTIENEEQELEAQKKSVSFFGYELIRDVLLGDLLGPDASDILYWGGKGLARRFPCEGDAALAAFFQEAGWGNIELVSEGKMEHRYRLSGGVAERRLNGQASPSFTLECGFVAEQIAARFQTAAEAISQPNKKSRHVDILVKWE